MGTENVVKILGPLLKKTQDNPHATLITHYLNTTMNARIWLGGKQPGPLLELESKETMQKLVAYRGISRPTGKMDAQILRFIEERDIFVDWAKYLEV